jgi:NADH:ubiquinone oxidoreductase subunit 6 (subunit J)
MAKNNGLLALGLTIVIVVAIIALFTFLIMLIWNNVLIKKFPTWKMQKLSFWDALWLAIFFGVLGSASSFFRFNYTSAGGLQFK